MAKPRLGCPGSWNSTHDVTRQRTDHCFDITAATIGSIEHTWPLVERHHGIAPVRNTLLAQKHDTLGSSVWKANQLVYHSSPEGGTQISLAYCTERWQKR